MALGPPVAARPVPPGSPSQDGPGRSGSAARSHPPRGASPPSEAAAVAGADAAAAIDLATLRRQLPITERWAYLNHATIGPLPTATAERLTELARDQQLGADRSWPERNAGVATARQRLARLLGAPDPASVAFVENTATALSLVAEGLAWKPGDNVVGAACEYPSNVYPWMNLSRRGVELRLAPEVDGRVRAEDLCELVDGRTRVVALSWVQYASGFRSDLARIGRFCRARDVLFVVDVIQGLGALALDVERAEIDVAAGACQKWLLGPEGVGFLYVAPAVLDRLTPVRAGWRSMRGMFDWDHLELDFNDGALAFECGTLNTFGILAAGESLALLLDLGPAAIERRVLALADRVASGAIAAGLTVASPRAAGERSSIVSLRHPSLPAAPLVARLAEHAVVVTERSGRIRLSPHVYNSEDEVDRAIELLAGR